MRLILATIILVVTLNSCVTPDYNNTANSLDAALRQSVDHIVDNLEKGSKIAVLNFTSPSPQFSEYVLEELSVLLVNSKHFSIVDRSNLNLIRSEINFQLSGDVDDDSVQAIGKMLGAQYIISGSISDIGSFYRVRLSTINIETAERQAASSYSVSKQDEAVVALLTDNNTGTSPLPGVSPLEGVWVDVSDVEPLYMVFIGNRMTLKIGSYVEFANHPFTYTPETFTFNDAGGENLTFFYYIQGDLMTLDFGDEDDEGYIMRRETQ